MADRYWVGGASTTWNTTTHWSASSGGPSGASVPTASDNVFFNSSSGSGFSVTVSVAAPMLNFTCSGCSVTFIGTNPMQIYGNVSVDGNVTFNGAINSGILSLLATGSVTISLGSYPTPGINFNGTGTYTLLADIGSDAARATTFTLTSGTLVLNGYTMYCGIWASNTSVARTIDMSVNNSRIVTNSSSAGLVSLQMTTVTGLTTNITGTNSGIYINSSLTGTIVYGTAGITATNLMSVYLNGTGAVSMTTGSSYSYLEANSPLGNVTSTIIITPHTGGAPAYGLKLAGGGFTTSYTFNFTGSDSRTTVNFTNTGNYSIAGLGITRPNAGLNFIGSSTIAPSGTLTLTSGYLKFVNGGDTISCGIFSSSSASTRSIIAQNTASLSIGSGTYSNAIYLTANTAGLSRLTMTNTTGFSYSGSFCFASSMNLTATFAFGSSSGSTPQSNLCPPLAIYGGTSAPSLSNSYFSKLDFTGSTTTPVASNVYVTDLILPTTGTYTSATFIFANTTGSLTSSGKVLSAITVGTASYSGYLKLNDAASVSGAFNLTNGSLYLQGLTLTVAAQFIISSNPTYISFASGRIVLNASGSALSAPAVNHTTDQTGGFQCTATVARSLGFGSTSGATLTNVPNVYITSGTLTITFTGYFNLIDATGTTANILGSTIQTVNLISLTVPSGASWTALHTLNFFGTGTLYANGGTAALGIITINSSGTYVTGTVPTYGLTLAATITLAGTLTLNSGTLNLNGYGISGFAASTLVTYNLGASSITGLLFNGGYITINNTTAGQTPINFANTTNLYTDWYTGSGGFAAAMSVTRTFNIGGTAAGPYLINVSLTSGAAVPTLTGSGFGLINFTGSTLNPGTVSLTCSGLTLASGGTYTGLTVTFKGTPPSSAVTGYSAACATFTPNGKPIVQMTVNALWTGSAGGVTYTNYNSATVLGGAVTFTLGTATTYLTSGTLKVNGFTLTTGVFDYSTTNIASILFGGGTIALANTTGFAYVMNMPNLTNFTNDQNGGFSTALSVYRYFTCGTTGYVLQSQAASNISLTITSGVALPLFDSGCTFGYLDMSAVTYGVPAITLNVGAIKYSAGVGASPNFPPTFRYLWPTMTFTTGEATIGTTVVQPGSSSAPAFKIIGNLTVNGTLSLVQSANNAIDLNGYSITATNFIANANSNIGNIICTAANSTTSAINLSGSGNVWASNNITVMSNVRVNLTSTSDKAIDGNGNTTFGNVNNTGVGNLTIQNSDTFGNLNIVANPTTLTFTTGKQPVINYLYANGNSTSGNLVTINSNNPGTLANVQVTHPLSIDYVSIKDIQAITTTWYANKNSVNGGNNVNIVFPNGVNGQFFAFY